jgi:hypothetical protein
MASDRPSSGEASAKAGSSYQAPEIGKIERVQLREVWKHEALGFTTWLEQNLDVLSDLTGLSLVEPHREMPIGDFSLDLHATDKLSGRLVVIENQLERSDHDHLGKLITYLAGVERADIAIWIVADARPEHVKAVTWMNDSVNGVEFYLLKLQAVRIAPSPPAPLLTLITGPSSVTRQIREVKRELSEDQIRYQEFWAGLIDKAAGQPMEFADAVPRTGAWLGRRVGNYQTLEYVVYKHKGGRVELYIDHGDASGIAIFDRLKDHQEVVEATFGSQLDWIRKERGSCSIGKTYAIGGYAFPDKWPELQEAMIDGMIRLEKALHPYIEGAAPVDVTVS